MSKEDLLEALRVSGEDVMRQIAAVPSADLGTGRYENRWNGRQILAHLAAIEWTYPRLLSAGESTGGASDRENAPRGGMDGYNARQVEKRSDASVAQLLSEFEQNRAATIAAVEAADETTFTRPVHSAGGRTGTVARVLYEVAVLHVQQHVRDIVGGG